MISLPLPNDRLEVPQAPREASAAYPDPFRNLGLGVRYPLQPKFEKVKCDGIVVLSPLVNR